MGNEKILIVGIEKKIERKLKELNLKPKVSPKEFLEIHGGGKHRYFSPCKKGEEMVAFYARLHDNLDAKEKFIREIEFLEWVKKSQIKIKNLMPEILNSGLEKDFEWLVREYPRAPPLGTSRSIIQQPSLKIIAELTKAIFEISKLKPRNLPGIPLKKFNYRNYLAPGAYVNLLKRKIITADLFQKSSKKIQKLIPLLKKENHYFSHGDLNLGNILSDGKEIWIIDWELIHFNNFAYDIGYLWAHLWQAKREFRKKLIKSYLKNLNSTQLTKFKKLLPVVVSYLSLGGIEYKKEREKLKILEKRRKFYLKLLENCTKDFETLINA